MREKRIFFSFTNMETVPQFLSQAMTSVRPKDSLSTKVVIFFFLIIFSAFILEILVKLCHTQLSPRISGLFFWQSGKRPTLQLIFNIFFLSFSPLEPSVRQQNLELGIQRIPESFYSRFCNHWVSFAGVSNFLLFEHWFIAAENGRKFIT